MKNNRTIGGQALYLFIQALTNLNRSLPPNVSMYVYGNDLYARYFIDLFNPNETSSTYAQMALRDNIVTIYDQSIGSVTPFLTFYNSSALSSDVTDLSLPFYLLNNDFKPI